MEDVFKLKLRESIVAQNSYIANVAKAMVVLLIFIIIAYFLILFTRKHSHTKPEKCLYGMEHIFNELFITGISIFPLLGLYGTVKALLSIDFSTEMANVQANFFDALTSTAWGIIFAIIFKAVNAILAPCMERLFSNEEKRLYSSGTEKPPFVSRMRKKENTNEKNPRSHS